MTRRKKRGSRAGRRRAEEAAAGPQRAAGCLGEEAMPRRSGAETERGTRGGTATTDPGDPRRGPPAPGVPVAAATPGTGAAEALRGTIKRGQGRQRTQQTGSPVVLCLATL